MRFVDKDDIELLIPADWVDKAREAWEYVDEKIETARAKAESEHKTPVEIEETVVETRKKAIIAKSSIWRDAGKIIKNVMHDKCWYCETLEVRSDMPVDHFRPKNSVAECPSHPGYWWLAFDWENYRYSCTFCNERRTDVENKTAGGKWDHFPIFEPPAWARTATDNWRLERPQLLDPLEIDDTKLLTFHEDGYPREVVQVNTDERYIRAKKSIDLYHLDHIKAVRARKTIAITIKNKYDRIEQLLTLDITNPIVAREIREKKKELIRLIRQNAPFCTAAKVYLQRYRETDWVQDLLDRDL